MAQASVRLEGRGVPGLAGGAVFLGVGCFFLGFFGFTSTGRSFAAVRGAAVAGVALVRAAVAVMLVGMVAMVTPIGASKVLRVMSVFVLKRSAQGAVNCLLGG